MTKEIDNQRNRDASEVGGDYLQYIETRPDGSSVIYRFDADNLGFTQWTATSDGKYSSVQQTKEGHVDHIVEGGLSVTASNRTDSVDGNHDAVATGSKRDVKQQGSLYEDGAEHAHVGQDVSIKSTSGTQTSMSDDHGHHPMKGNQTFHVEEGSIHYDIEQNFTVDTNQAIKLASKQAMKLHSDQDFGHTIDANRTVDIQGFSNTKVGTTTTHYSGQDITIESGTKITLKVGSSKIIIENDTITLSINNNKGIKITDSDIIITGTSWVGQSDINTKDGPATPPFHSP